MACSDRRLRIAVIAPPFYEIPPRSYGGIELVCYLLVEGLVARGHEVTLIAAGTNHTRARFCRTLPDPVPEGTDEEMTFELLHSVRAAAALETVGADIVHDHSRAGPLTAVARAVPTVLTVHAPVAGVAGAESQVQVLEGLGRWMAFVAISEAQRRQAPHLNWAATVHNGIVLDDHPFSRDRDGFLLYLGRMSAQKGVHLAIDAARTVGMPLVIAGSWTIPEEKTYFDEEVRPRLGGSVEWIGEVAGEQKMRLLAGTACLLFPSTWEEPFGLVMVEAMACGAPVVGLRRGSVPEIVADGRTGVVCDTPAQLPEAISVARGLDPHDCRLHVANMFSAEKMVSAYETTYRNLLASGS